MATQTSILPQRILWTEEPGGLLSIGSHTVRYDWSILACMHALEKEMATHCSILAWRVPGTEELGGLPSMGSHRVGHYWSDLAAAAAYFFLTGKFHGQKSLVRYSPWGCKELGMTKWLNWTALISCEREKINPPIIRNIILRKSFWKLSRRIFKSLYKCECKSLIQNI